MKRKTLVEKLFDRLRAEGWHLPDGCKFRRLYPGLNQRDMGAWSWTIECYDGCIVDYGSCETVKACVDAVGLERLENDGEICTATMPTHS